MVKIARIFLALQLRKLFYNRYVVFLFYLNNVKLRLWNELFLFYYLQNYFWKNNIIFWEEVSY